jgi:hypothetical protein
MSIDNGEEVRVTSATGGQKGQKDARLGAIDPLAILELAKVAGFGAKKYDSFNYLRGYDWHLSIDAADRHGLQFAAGEDLDPESGLCHAAHAAWNYLALTSFYLRGLGTDDRVSAFLAKQSELSGDIESLAGDSKSDETFGLDNPFPCSCGCGMWFDRKTGAAVDGPEPVSEWVKSNPDPAPDFYYYGYVEDWPRIVDSESEVIDNALDESEINTVDNNIYFQVHNPEVFGEFRPINRPFRVGDKVEVNGISSRTGKIDNLDWQAESVRVIWDEDGKPSWVNVRALKRVSLQPSE